MFNLILLRLEREKVCRPPFGSAGMERRNTWWRTFCPLCTWFVFRESGQVVCEVRWRVFGVLARRVSGVLWCVWRISKTSLWSSTLLLHFQELEKRTFASPFYLHFEACQLNWHCIWIVNWCLESGRNITAFGTLGTTFGADVSGTFGT